MNKKRLSIFIALNFVTSTLLFPTATVFAASTTSKTVAPISIYGVKYEAHVQSFNWQALVNVSNRTDIKNAPIAGSTGKSLRMEAVKITLKGLPGYAVEYQAHVQGIS